MLPRPLRVSSSQVLLVVDGGVSTELERRGVLCSVLCVVVLCGWFHALLVRVERPSLGTHVQVSLHPLLWSAIVPVLGEAQDMDTLKQVHMDYLRVCHVECCVPLPLCVCHFSVCL